MTAHNDSPREIRKGEELDLVALQTWMESELPELAGPITVTQFPSGHSNLTYCLSTQSGDLVLRRPPFGARVKSGHDMGREYRVLSALWKVYDKAPRALAFCEDDSVLGAPFYVMERVEGVILRGRVPTGLDPTPSFMRKLSQTTVDTLVELHQVDVEAAELADLGRPSGYVERQITGWNRRWEKSRTDPVPEMDQVGQWLVENMPGEVGSSLIHNDFKYDNIVLHPRGLPDTVTVRAVLDWEMCTLGCPLMDLGTSLGYWRQKGDPQQMAVLPLGLTHLEGNLTRSEVVARYAEQSGVTIDDPVFYYAYGLFKLGVIIQQIYQRYKLGLTKDERFAAFLMGVQLVSKVAATAIARESIDDIDWTR